MKTSNVKGVAMVSLLSADAAMAQNANMMNGGWMGGWMGGYGGAWVPILLVIVVAALVAWVVARGRK